MFFYVIKCSVVLQLFVTLGNVTRHYDLRLVTLFGLQRIQELSKNV